MRTTIAIICILFSYGTCIAEQKSAGKIFESKNFEDYNFDSGEPPSLEQLSIIWFVLSSTGESNIHRMRGEKDNTVYIRKSDENKGYQEAVYNGAGALVTNSYNQGSFNYYHYKEKPIKHFLYDSLPWLEWGNAKDDPTSFKERLYHYSLDLNLGIQAYIFSNAEKENLPKIEFGELSKEERLTYMFCNYILFNEKYSLILPSYFGLIL